ncbi:MAG: ATP-dependent DNA helicase RecG [Burkholderiaceae bacterium]|nr:MAG: ATP-dependent DNA helicase RecG [Burkholderiaceae bacterium]
MTEKKPKASPLSARLARLGLHSDADLILHFPLRYEDRTQVTPIAEAGFAALVQVQGTIVTAEVKYRPRRQLVCQLEDDSGVMVLRFLNFYPSQVQQLQVGSTIRARGEPRAGFFGTEMVHPACEWVDAGQVVSLPDCLTPIYPTTAGLPQRTLQKLIERALAHPWPDTLPAPIVQRLQLPEFDSAIRVLHQPTPDTDTYALVERIHPAWQRIKFDELLAQQISLHRARAQRFLRHAPVLAQSGALEKKLLAQLPFVLTAAQERVWQEIGHDLAQPYPMSRLLQGDVGCGKTVIAAQAAARAIDAGYQAAIMAPTEILAEQHYRKLSGWFAPLGITVCWLTGALTAAEKRAAVKAIEQGEVHLVVGTHALIEDTVNFPRLGLAVVDEQHRFGVAQRVALRNKGRSKKLLPLQGGGGEGDGVNAQSHHAPETHPHPNPPLEGEGENGASHGSYPHQLMMSATPIPRTLAMTYYADLDVSVIDELPLGRTPVKTKLVTDSRRAEVIERIRHAVQEGRQIYWVCPLIEESEALQLQTATATHADLCAALPELNIGLLHGRLSSSDKAAVMQAFIAGQVHLLVATTVIEVGVDVSNASLMVIENAERFGLAQLHQLRGRVGRGSAESTCILLYQKPLSSTARDRLQAMFETSDGFEIARRDLQIRGPGEFLGARQSGEALLRYADLQHDTAVVELARQTAQDMLTHYEEASGAHLRRWLAGREDYLKA